MGRKSISMTAAIIISFILFITTIITICYTLLFNWKASADSMINKVEAGTSKDILSKIESFINIPLQLNETNHRLIESRIVDLSDSREREIFFAGVIKTNIDAVYSFSYGTENGEYYGARRNEKNQIEIMKNNAETGGNSWYYFATEDLTSGAFALDAGKFDVRSREWYKIAKEQKRTAFSPIYKHFVMNDLAISAVYPIFNKDGSLQGVLGTHIILSKINSYLKEISSDIGAAAYIIETETGELVANSLDMPNFKSLAETGADRITLDEIDQTCIKAAYQKYRNESDNNFIIKAPKDKLHISFTEYRKEGLNWLVVTAIPESSFTAEIAKSMLISIYVALIALIVSVLIYLKIAEIVLKPIHDLIKTTEKFSKGDLISRARIHRNDEIGRLSKAFNKMADELVTYITDLEKKVKERTEELEKANQAKSQFLAVMSHEIRTPMNGIIGSLQFLERTQLRDEQTELIQTIKNSADILLSITNNILDVSKIEAGKLELEHIPFNIRETAEAAVSSFSAAASEKGILLSLETDSDIPEIVLGDPIKLKQVISNLTSNAVKFTEAGKVYINALLSKQKGNSVELEFIVSDTGIGMSEQEISRIFNPFTQADLSSTRKYGGTGLGLTICKSIIEKMGGGIKVTSKEGKGTSFIFTLILERAEDSETSIPTNNISESKKVESATSDNTNNTGKLKILLAEDNLVNRKLFIKILKLKGLTCDIAVNGEEAVKAYSDNDYDIIFMDCQMPVMDGYEAARQIRAAEKNRKRPAIIAMTAYAMKGDEEKCLEAGMDAYLSKPVNLDQVMGLLQKYEMSTYGDQTEAIDKHTGEIQKQLYLTRDEILSDIDLQELFCVSRQLDELNLLKDKLFEHIAHDIRSPIAAMVSMMEVLEYDYGSEDSMEIIKAVRKQVTDTFSGIEGLYSCVSRNNEQPEKHILEIAKLAVKAVCFDKEERPVSIKSNIGHGVTVIADDETFKKIVFSLLDNMIKHYEGQGLISIKMQRAGQKVFICIRDTGITGDIKTVKNLINKADKKLTGVIFDANDNAAGKMIYDEFIQDSAREKWLEIIADKGLTLYLSLSARMESNAFVFFAR